MIPGLHGIVGGGLSLSIVASEDDVDVFARVGSPSGVVRVSVSVASGVVVGAALTSAAAMIFSGFAAGSTFYIFNAGRIGGAGGAGGRGGEDTGAGSPGFLGAGGGGGAGTTPGAGGLATGPATNGTVGTATAGGTHGTSSNRISGAPIVSTESGLDGGDAISHGAFDLNITNGSGEIWGGGGGGMGGFDTPPGENGGDGGAPGADAPLVLVGGSGSGGNSIRGTGSITWISGNTSPNVEGDIGA